MTARLGSAVYLFIGLCDHRRCVYCTELVVVSQKTKKKTKEKSISRFEELDFHTDRGVCVPSDLRLALFSLPPRIRLVRILRCQIQADRPSPKDTSRFWGHLTPVTFSDQLTWTDSSDQPTTFEKAGSARSFSVSLFPFSSALFSPALIQSHQVASFKPTVDLLANQADDTWVTYFLLTHLVTCFMDTSTRIYSQKHMHICIHTRSYFHHDTHTLTYSQWHV